VAVVSKRRVKTLVIPIEPARRRRECNHSSDSCAAYLDAHGVPHTTEPCADDYDNPVRELLGPFPFETVRRVKEERPLVRVVPAASTDRRRTTAAIEGGDGRARPESNPAGPTSRFSRASTSRMEHDDEVSTSSGRTARSFTNPVDLALFFARGPEAGGATLGRPAVACVSWSTNQGKGTR